MNREIKFRIWDCQLKRWYGNTIFEEPPQLDSDFSLSLNPKLKVINQFTGLRDKNGVEIYFKDIVKAPSGNLFEVCWHEDELRIALKRFNTWYNFNTPLYEVIGNIYENTDLLK